MTDSVPVRAASAPSVLARPKSVILSVPSFATRMLEGFRSRWMIPLRVGRLHGPGQRPHPTRRPGRRLGHAADRLGEAAAFDELEREERPTVLLAHFVDLDDVGVLEPRDGLGLGAEAGRLGHAGVAPRQDHLERHLAIEADMPRPVDHAHPAAAELPQDLIAGQLRARARRRRIAVPRRPTRRVIPRRSDRAGAPTPGPDAPRGGRRAARRGRGTAARSLPSPAIHRAPRAAGSRRRRTRAHARSRRSSRGFRSKKSSTATRSPSIQRRRWSARNSSTRSAGGRSSVIGSGALCGRPREA